MTVAADVSSRPPRVRSLPLELDQVDAQSRVLHIGRLKDGLSTTQPLRRDEFKVKALAEGKLRERLKLLIQPQLLATSWLSADRLPKGHQVLPAWQRHPRSAASIISILLHIKGDSFRIKEKLRAAQSPDSTAQLISNAEHAYTKWRRRLAPRAPAIEAIQRGRSFKRSKSGDSGDYNDADCISYGSCSLDRFPTLLNDYGTWAVPLHRGAGCIPSLSPWTARAAGVPESRTNRFRLPRDPSGPTTQASRIHYP